MKQKGTKKTHTEQCPICCNAMYPAKGIDSKQRMECIICGHKTEVA